MFFLKNMLIIINITLFGLGSFLCFTVAVVESQDRFLVGGVFLLLFTFVNQKIIYMVFE